MCTVRGDSRPTPRRRSPFLVTEYADGPLAVRVRSTRAGPALDPPDCCTGLATRASPRRLTAIHAAGIVAPGPESPPTCCSPRPGPKVIDFCNRPGAGHDQPDQGRVSRSAPAGFMAPEQDPRAGAGDGGGHLHLGPFTVGLRRPAGKAPFGTGPLRRHHLPDHARRPRHQRGAAGPAPAGRGRPGQGPAGPAPPRRNCWPS